MTTAEDEARRTVGNLPQCLASLSSAAAGHFDPAQLPLIVQTLLDAQVMALSLQHHRNSLPRLLKTDSTLVTAADLAIQALMARVLRAGEPLTPIVAEEDPRSLEQGDSPAFSQVVTAAVQRLSPSVDTASIANALGTCTHETAASEYWTLDPLDGTKGFLRGEHFAIALARIRAGAVVFAALACPTLSSHAPVRYGSGRAPGPVLIAFRGQGAWQFDVEMGHGTLHALRLPSESPKQFRVCESVESAHSDHDVIRRIASSAGRSADPLRVDGQTKYALVARGQAEAYVRVPVLAAHPDAIWDHAAGSLIASEAGAIVTDLHGAPLDFGRGPTLSGNCGIVCAHPALHRLLIEAVPREWILG